MERCLERLRQYLNEHGVKYEVQHHREVYTIQEVAAEVGEKGHHVAKVFIAHADDKPIMLVLAAPDHVDYQRVKDYLGAEHVERAREEEFKRLFPDCDVGAMPPFGNLYHIPVYLERGLSNIPYIVFQAGSHSDTIKMAMEDYLRLAAPKITRFASVPEPAEPVT